MRTSVDTSVDSVHASHFFTITAEYMYIEINYCGKWIANGDKCDLQERYRCRCRGWNPWPLTVKKIRFYPIHHNNHIYNPHLCYMSSVAAQAADLDSVAGRVGDKHISA